MTETRPIASAAPGPAAASTHAPISARSDTTGRTDTADAALALQDAVYPLTGLTADFDPLLDLIGDARFVLLGEASHGTDEFYRARIEITQRLIDERGFTAVAVEADWPDAWRVNRFVHAAGEGRVAGPDPEAHQGPEAGQSLAAGVDLDADQALSGFKRFPTWMWRNTAIRDFIEWLRALNDVRERGARKVGFYGLDLYSLHASIEAVLAYLDRTDPDAAARARSRYACFESFGEDTQRYGYAAGLGLAESCEREVVSQLVELRRAAGRYASRRSGGGPDGREAADEFFHAEQNARLVKNAEEYYRAMFRSHIGSWNLRDRHMAESFEALAAHLGRFVPQPKIVVWAHNSHLGDARATEVHARGELNLGQLIRERHGRDAVLVGFSTYDGHVTAAREWDGPAERKRVRPALAGSIEALFHETRIPRFLLPLRTNGAADDPGRAATELLRPPRLERAIGVIYRPETERVSHYFSVELPAQFDAILHYDHTHAVEPLERTAPWESGEPEETYPSGL